jgi:hypothetical protein
VHPQPVPERAPEQDVGLPSPDARAPEDVGAEGAVDECAFDEPLAPEEPAIPTPPHPHAAAANRARRTRVTADADPSSSPALPQHGAQQVVAGAIVMTAAVVAFDVALTARLSMFFDLCFVLVGLWAALVVRRQGLYAVGVLPPLLLGAVVAFLAVTMPSTLTASHLAFVSTWLTGLAHHGIALGATHVVVLAIVGLRAGEARGRRAR